MRFDVKRSVGRPRTRKNNRGQKIYRVTEAFTRNPRQLRDLIANRACHPHMIIDTQDQIGYIRLWWRSRVAQGYHSLQS